MKNIIKSIFPIVIVIVLFCSAAFADGDMSNGGKTCTGNTCPGFAPTGGNQPTDFKTDDIQPIFVYENPISAFVKKFLEEIGMI